MVKQDNCFLLKKILLLKFYGKFQDDWLNQKILIRIDCSAAKHILEKNVKNIASKQIFARWQSILSVFDYDIEYIKGESNSLPDFLTREFLQSVIQHEPPLPRR